MWLNTLGIQPPSAEDPGINKTKERRGKERSERSIRNRLLLSYQPESDEVMKLI